MYVHKKCAYMERRYFWTKAYLISVGILNPALLTVAADHCSNTLLYSIAYWSIWTLQVSSSVITSYSTMARFDKKHFAYIHYKNRLDDEIWAFIELRDAYAAVDSNIEHEKTYLRTFHHTKYKILLLNCERVYKDMSSHIYTTGVSDCTHDKKEASAYVATNARNPDRDDDTCLEPSHTQKFRSIHQSISDPGTCLGPTRTQKFGPIRQSISDPGPSRTYLQYPQCPPHPLHPPYPPCPTYLRSSCEPPLHGHTNTYTVNSK